MKCCKILSCPERNIKVPLAGLQAFENVQNQRPPEPPGVTTRLMIHFGGLNDGTLGIGIGDFTIDNTPVNYLFRGSDNSRELDGTITFNNGYIYPDGSGIINISGQNFSGLVDPFDGIFNISGGYLKISRVEINPTGTSTIHISHGIINFSFNIIFQYGNSFGGFFSIGPSTISLSNPNISNGVGTFTIFRNNANLSINGGLISDTENNGFVTGGVIRNFNEVTVTIGPYVQNRFFNITPSIGSNILVPGHSNYYNNLFFQTPRGAYISIKGKVLQMVVIMSRQITDGSYRFDLRRNGTSVGTLTISTGDNGIVSLNVNYNVGDLMDVECIVTPNGNNIFTIASCTITILYEIT